MSELISTAQSPWVDPHLHVWGWEIPVYLFLGGWTAGIMVLCGWALWKGQRDERPHATFSLASSGLFILAFAAISLGMLALFLDLEHKLFVWRLYVTFEPASPMSWGAWILILVYPVLLMGILLDPPLTLTNRVPQLVPLLKKLADNLTLRRITGLLAIGTGVALGIYTGILLSALGARPLWSSAILGPLFLFSGLSAAAAFAHWASPDQPEREYLAKIDNQFLASELAIVLLFLIGLTTSTEAHLQAAQLFLGGAYTAVFWVGVVGLGIVLPLIIQSLAVTHRVPHTPLAPVLVILGGLALRFVIVSAGQISHWSRL
ncbi:MAG: polysulfide reductase NrfD [Acidobacteria bacterium]|jgi:protein NrfD|nr:polysulfide reductase NrfD [Acidobacteriota bacterium]